MPIKLLPVDFDPSTLYAPESKHVEFDAESTRKWAARSKTPLFAAAAPRLMYRDPQPTSLLRYYKQAMLDTYGKSWRWFPRMQWDGTCVGQSHQLIGAVCMAINCLLEGTKYPGEPTVAGAYAGSRVDVAKKPGRWEGSNGNWAATWYTEKGGIVLGSSIGLPDGVLTQEQWLSRNKKDEQIAMKWTNSREGVPTELENAAKLRPIRGSSMVTTTAEVRAAISNLQPVNICSRYIPSGKRDANGFSPMSRKGGHSTAIMETHKRGKTWAYTYVQSWWHWAKGPSHLDGDPFMEDFKTAVCLISESELSRVLASRDCYTFWGAQGLDPIEDTYRI